MLYQHILTQLFNQKNFQLDTMILILFLCGIVICINLKEINYFAYLVLIKSIAAFLIKLRYLDKAILNLKILIFQNILFLIIFFFKLKVLIHFIFYHFFYI